MKTMFHNLSLIVLLLLSFVGVAHAASLNTEGLTAEQLARIEATIATTRADNAASGVTSSVAQAVVEDPERLSRYAEIGKAVAQSVGVAAKELGIAVDEFMNTGTGTMVMFLVVYHFFGAELLTFAVGFFFVVPLTFFLSRKYINTIKIDGYEWDEKGKKRVILNKNLNKSESDALIWSYVITVIILLLEIFTFLPG